MSFEKFLEQRQLCFLLFFHLSLTVGFVLGGNLGTNICQCCIFLVILMINLLSLSKLFLTKIKMVFSWRGLVWSASVNFFPFCMIMILAMIDIIKVNDKRVVHLFVI